MAQERTSVWETIAHLAHAEANAGVEPLDAIDPIDCLLEVVLAFDEAPLVSVTSIPQAIEEQFGMGVSEAEIRASAERLRESGSITIGGPDDATLSIGDLRRKELRDLSDDTEQLTSEVFSEWRDSLKSEYALSSEALDELELDLRQVLTSAFVRYGADCINLLSIGTDRANALQNRIQEDLLVELPEKKGLVGRIRNLELAKFFKTAPAKRLRFFGHLLNSSYILYGSQLDPGTFRAVKERLQDSTVILDTNMVFSILGLNGEPRKQATLQVVALSLRLGMRVEVTQRSMTEFLHSVRDVNATIGSRAPLDAALAAVVAELGEDSVLRAYYERYARDGISFDLFEAEYRLAASRFGEMGIIVGDDLEETITNDPQVSVVANRILHICGPRHEQLWERELSMGVCEHDAFHLRLIQEKRGEVPIRFLDAKVWFLTWDSKLPYFARVDRDRLGDVPFCIPTPIWLSFVGGLSERSQDYEATASSMLWSTGLQSVIQLPVDRLGQIARTMQSMHERDPHASTLLLLDARFIHSMRTASEEQFDKEIPKLIDDSALSALQDLDNEIHRVRTEGDANAEDSIAELVETEEIVKRLRAEIAGGARTAGEEKKEYERGLKEVERELESSRGDVAGLDSRLDVMSRTTMRVAIALRTAITVIVVGSMLALLAATGIERDSVIWQLGLFLFGLSVIGYTWMGWKRALGLLAALAAFATVLGVAINLVDRSDPDTPTQEASATVGDLGRNYVSTVGVPNTVSPAPSSTVTLLV